jgi:type IV secretory pathway VirB3-like protein
MGDRGGQFPRAVPRGKGVIMAPQTFFIRSVMVQNIIMGIIVAVVVAVFVRCIRKREPKYTIAVVIWAGMAVWFFNGPFWGFSAVTVSGQGLEVEYGFLSVFLNTTLPVDTHWKIRKYLGGIRKLKNLYYLQLANHRSLKVRGPDKLEVLKALGAAIDDVNGRSMGRLIERPVNM